MNFYVRKNDTDFRRWCWHIVPYAMVVIRSYEKDPLSLIVDSTEYRETLAVKKQLMSIRSKLDKEHLLFLDNILLKKKLPEWGDKEGRKLYHDIYRTWQRVCFPKGSNGIKDLNPVLLGGELKRVRIIRGIFVKQAAELIGISPRALYSYEDGTREMRVNTLYKLCQVYKVSVSEVIDNVTGNKRKESAVFIRQKERS